MGLITETNAKYYAGEKVFLVLDGASSGPLATTFDTELQLTTSTQNSNFEFEFWKIENLIKKNFYLDILKI